MKMWLIVVVAFLMAVTAGIADADWNWLAAKPQPFRVFDGYVIAVGTPDDLEPVQACDIVTALQDGKEIRLEYA